MTVKNYANLQSPTRVMVKSGSVSNDRRMNNRYWRNDGFASGEIVATDWFHDYRAWPTRVENRLYSKLTDSIAGGGKAQLLTAAAEWKSSLEMVTRRTLWLLDSYKSFRRFDLPAAVRKLTRPVARPASSLIVQKNERGFTSYNRRPRRKREVQNATEGWLEYWLGWAPAMGDIYAALDVLQRPFPKQHISVAARYEATYKKDLNYPGYSKGSEQVTHKGSLGVYADMQITNYNLFLMNQMGLLNPLTTGYNIIPFSFVLGWFVNVEQCLNQLTDFAGVSLQNTGLGHYQTRESSRSVFLLEWYSLPNGDFATRWVPSPGTYFGVSHQRLPGLLPTPQLTVKFDRLSLTRAATAVSLLVEIFLRKRD